MSIMPGSKLDILAAQYFGQKKLRTRGYFFHDVRTDYLVRTYCQESKGPSSLHLFLLRPLMHKICQEIAREEEEEGGQLAERKGETDRCTVVA